MRAEEQRVLGRLVSVCGVDAVLLFYLLLFLLLFFQLSTN